MQLQPRCLCRFLIHELRMLTRRTQENSERHLKADGGWYLNLANLGKRCAAYLLQGAHGKSTESKQQSSHHGPHFSSGFISLWQAKIHQQPKCWEKTQEATTAPGTRSLPVMHCLCHIKTSPSLYHHWWERVCKCNAEGAALIFPYK